jgi:hypothetical protein
MISSVEGSFARRLAPAGLRLLPAPGAAAGAPWVDAARVRDALARHDEVADAVVLPVRDPDVLVAMSALPTTASGKVDRADLSRRLAEELAGESGIRRAVP